MDIHQHITDQIIAMLDRPLGEFQLPWHVPGGLTRPVNAATGKAYKGVNILALWAAGELFGYSSGLWATYRQWAALGAQVRKGEKGSYIVFYKSLSSSAAEQASEDEAAAGKSDLRAGRLIARASVVFAAEQVEDFHPPERPAANPVATLGAADTFVRATGAIIQYGGHQAFYRPSTDSIHMPPPEAFHDTAYSSGSSAFHAVSFHELTHWSGHTTRCNRDLNHRFGSEAYAMEELVAELGAAFLCGDLGITPAPRADHAQYIANWLQVLRDDRKAIFTAASKASQAVAFLHQLQTSPPERERRDVPAEADRTETE
jgi:antirestriction protein ArdC